MRPLDQLVNGVRGSFDKVPVSEEYKKCLDTSIERDKKMRELLAPTHDLLTQYIDTIDSLGRAHAACISDLYMEGLRFGILLGLDIAKE